MSILLLDVVYNKKSLLKNERFVFTKGLLKKCNYDE